MRSSVSDRIWYASSMTAHGHVRPESVAHFAAVPAITGQPGQVVHLLGDAHRGVACDARRRRVAESREPTDGQAGRGERQAVDQVVDLPVGLRHDHDRLTRCGEFRRGSHHQGRLPGARRGVHHDSAVAMTGQADQLFRAAGAGQVRQVGQHAADCLLRQGVGGHHGLASGGHAHTSFASSSAGTYSGGGPPWVHGVSSRGGNDPDGW